VKAGYRQILEAKREDRRPLFVEATEEWPTSANFIEKDFIVCAALNVLFGDQPEEAGKLVFKGGTSLSKAHSLIRRFSEDIDLVIIREELGFGGDRDPFAEESSLSRKKRERLVDELREAATKYVQGVLQPMLRDAFGPFGATVDIDPTSDGQTVLIAYKSAFDEPDPYVRDIVKVEAGARSATLPAHSTEISPYAAGVAPDIDLKVEGVQTVDAERTFLDKVLILHGRHCKFRDTGEIHRNANAESRHYYDLAMMMDDIGEGAIANAELFADVIRHTSLAFGSAWMKLDEAANGDMLIIPPDGMRAALKKDYAAMAGMIMGDAPSFDAVMKKIERIADLQAKSIKITGKPEGPSAG